MSNDVSGREQRRGFRQLYWWGLVLAVVVTVVALFGPVVVAKFW